MPITLESGEQYELNITLTALIVNGRVFGNISDATTGDPIVGATIQLQGNQSYITASGPTGFYELNDVIPGSYTVTISAVGYETAVI